MTEQHTPGPWKLRDNAALIRVVAGPLYTTVADGISGEADARLIEAAPELLEACKLFISYDDASADDVSSMLLYDEARSAIRAAYAKATGGQS